MHKLFKKDLFFWCLMLVFVTGLFLRLYGMHPGYPPNYPDEPIVNDTALQMAVQHRLDPFTFPSYKFQYPGFAIYLYAYIYSFILFFNLVVLFLFHPLTLLKGLSDLPLFIQQRVYGPNEIYPILWGRYITAIIGFLAIVLCYLIGKRFFNKYIGFVAAFFLAINIRHITSSHFALVDVPNSVTALFSLYFTLALYERPSRRNYFLAALSVGVSLATKLYIFSIPPFLLAHFLVSIRKKSIHAIVKNLFKKDFFLSTLLIGAVFLLLNPFLLFHLSLALETQRINNLRYGMGSNVLLSGPMWYLYEIGFGKLSTFLLFAGIIIASVNPSYRIKAIFVLLFILPPAWTLLYYSNGGGYVRNFSSVVPFGYLFSAIGLYVITTFILKKYKQCTPTKTVITLFILSLVAGFTQLKYSFQMDYWLTKGWGYVCAEQMDDRLVENNQTFARSSVVPELTSKKARYLIHGNAGSNKGDFSLAELQEAGADYLGVNYTIIQSYFINWTAQGFPKWGMPVGEFDNLFEGLALKELSRYQIAGCIRPWPSIDDNYALFKIPKPAIIEDTMQIASKSQVITIPSQSPPSFPKHYVFLNNIPVEAGKEYVIKGKLSAGKPLDAKNRDGFLRVDFYTDAHHGEERGELTTVSPRYFGDDWKEETVSQVAPHDAHFMTVSFQGENYQTSLSVKDVIVSVVNATPSKDEIRAANVKEVDNTIIYPISIL